MPLYLLNQYGKQELVELPNDKHIQGEILWCDEKHGQFPEGIIVGAMDLIKVEEEIDDPSGAVDYIVDPNQPPPVEVVPVEGEEPPPVEPPKMIAVPRKIKREISRSLALNADKKLALDNEQALKDAKKIEKENKKKEKDNLLFKLKGENLKLDEVNALLRAMYHND